MRRMFRPALLAAGLAGVVLASGASAATGPTKLTFADPAGDNVSPSGASDITGVTFTTSGSGKGKAYTPKSLVLTLSLAKPPSSDGMVVYAIDMNLPGCGDVYVSYMPGANLLDSFNFASCGGDGSDPTGDGSSFDAVPEVKGSSIVWTIPFKTLPAPVKRGTQLTELNAYTDFVDPATSIVGPYSTVGVALYDTAETDSAYTVG